MLCAKPIPVNNQFVPCGQCMSCRINRKRSIIGQMLLEALYSENSSSFVTLTYNEENYPPDGSLEPHLLAAYVNRLRHKAALGPIRYFYVGEYGTKTQRAHYHMALFGVPPEVADNTCRKLWTKNGESIGFVHVGEITSQSVAYIAGYAVKKMGRNDQRLEGRYPEFNRRSRFPPLGAEAVYRMEDRLTTRVGAAALAKQGDVPSDFRYNGKTYPLANYWRKYLRARLDFTPSDTMKQYEYDLEGYIDHVKEAEKRSEKLEREYKRKERIL